MAPGGIPVAKICRTLPGAAPDCCVFSEESWFSTPWAKIAGQAAESATVIGALLAPSTVTTMAADVLEPSPAGTCKLICVALVYSSEAAAPSNVTATALPKRFVPNTVASEPETSGVASSVAAFTTLPTVTDGAVGGGSGGGGGSGAACTVRVKGMVWLPAAPPLMPMVA